jgi:hypothetical protein
LGGLVGIARRNVETFTAFGYVIGVFWIVVLRDGLDTYITFLFFYTSATYFTDIESQLAYFMIIQSIINLSAMIAIRDFRR